MEWYMYPAVVGIGLIAGFINTLAGSGSLITLPFLMFLGLPANVANGTNRIAILLQNVVSVRGFRQKKILSFREGLFFSVPAIVGAMAGARIAINLDEQAMRRTIGVLLVIMVILIIYKPERWLLGKHIEQTRSRKVFLIILFFFIGMYGGFIQAGVGFFLLAGLVLGAGANIVKANALKVFIILLYTPLALVFFMYYHQVNYMLGLVLAAGNMTGAWLGTRVAVSWGPRFIRIVLLLALIISAAKLTGLLDWLGRIFV
ncbi:MAG TPA: sulfite exporter TauE/SafE family protein [Bacteroidetes bacterium]|nr:sulfite exporter TauE/SafE family protein [Bacteroidota bacterium]